MSGVNGTCDRQCALGRPHELDCRNYIEVKLPCAVCSTLYGRHAEGCLMALDPTSPDSGSDQ